MNTLGLCSLYSVVVSTMNPMSVCLWLIQTQFVSVAAEWRKHLFSYFYLLVRQLYANQSAVFTDILRLSDVTGDTVLSWSRFLHFCMFCCISLVSVRSTRNAQARYPWSRSLRWCLHGWGLRKRRSFGSGRTLRFFLRYVNESHSEWLLHVEITRPAKNYFLAVIFSGQFLLSQIITVRRRVVTV